MHSGIIHILTKSKVKTKSLVKLVELDAQQIAHENIRVLDSSLEVGHHDAVVLKRHDSLNRDRAAIEIAVLLGAHDGDERHEPCHRENKIASVSLFEIALYVTTLEGTVRDRRTIFQKLMTPS